MDADKGTGGPSGKSAELEALEELEKECWKDMRQREMALYKQELAYQNECLAPNDTFPFVGNLASGWEILLEGKNPDKKKCTEKIYSGALASQLRVISHARAHTSPSHSSQPLRALSALARAPAESSRTWLNYREAQERKRAAQNAEAAERAAAAAYKVAEAQGRGGEAARAAAAAAGAAAIAAVGGKKRKEESSA
jgi:hypothetical protein